MPEISTNLLSQRVLDMTESATIKMAQLARELNEQGKSVISLSLGEPDFDTPQHIKDAAKKALDEGYTKYTPVPGLVELRKAISHKFKRDNNLDYSPNQIVVSNGAKQSIANLALAMLNPGDEVILFTPYWVSYYEIVRMAEGVPVPVSAGIENDYKVRARDVAAAITERTKLVLFSSPCNPTGSVYSKAEFEAIAEVLAPYPDIYIIADEIYEYINFSGSTFSIGSLPQLKDRVITVNGFAKGFAMTGWRLGYMGAPQWIADACTKIQGQFTSGATAFGQKAAAHALEADLGPTYAMVDQFHKRKDIVVQLLAAIPGFQVNDPEGAFYVFPDISAFFGKSHNGQSIENSEDFCAFLMYEALVGTVPGSSFGLEGCIRLSYATSEEVLREAIQRIADAVAKLQ